MQNLSNSKLDFIESLRGLLALLVILYHAPFDSFITGNFLRNGWIAVDIFFVISGYVISLNFVNLNTLQSVRKFITRRFFRLYPLHFIMLMVFLCFEFIKHIAFSYFGATPTSSQPFSSNNLTSFLSQLFLIQTLTGHAETWNLLSWSVSAEFLIYIVFSLSLFLARSNQNILLLVAIVISFICMVYLAFNDFTQNNGFPRVGFSFFVGVIIYILNSRHCLVFKKIKSYLLIGSSLLLIAIFYYSEGMKTSGINILIPIVFACMLLGLLNLQRKSLIIRFLEIKPLIYMGNISYSLYLIHNIFWAVLKNILVEFFDIPLFLSKNDGFRLIIENSLMANIILIFTLVVIFLVAHLSYKFIEKPMNLYRK